MICASLEHGLLPLRSPLAPNPCTTLPPPPPKSELSSAASTAVSFPQRPSAKGSSFSIMPSAWLGPPCRTPPPARAGGAPREIISGICTGGTRTRDQALQTRRTHQALKTLHLSQCHPPANLRKPVVAPPLVVQAWLRALL